MKIKEKLKVYIEKKWTLFKLEIRFSLIKFKINNIKLNKWRFKTVKIKANSIKNIRMKMKKKIIIHLIRILMLTKTTKLFYNGVTSICACKKMILCIK